MTQASSLGLCRDGAQGTSQSITRITSALGRSVLGSNPRCSGWPAGKLTCAGNGYSITGSANDSASATKAGTAAGLRPYVRVMIRGYDAWASSAATSSTRSGSGNVVVTGEGAISSSAKVN